MYGDAEIELEGRNGRREVINRAVVTVMQEAPACRLSTVAGTRCGSSGSLAKSSGTFGGSSGLLPALSEFWADVEGSAANAAA